MDDLGLVQGMAGESTGRRGTEVTQLTIDYPLQPTNLSEVQIDYLKRELGVEWFEAMAAYLGSHSFINIMKTVQEKRRSSLVYPSHDLVFRAFKETPYDTVRVVIFGQDPYHDGSATGLAFANSFNKPKMTSPSLGRIIETLNELDRIGKIPLYAVRPWHLEHWVKQGVLLLNKTLTVEYRKPTSHSLIWEGFAEQVIKALNKKAGPIVYLLWGNEAIGLAKYVDIKNPNHVVFTAEHPVAGVYSQPQREWNHKDCFILCNQFLEKNNSPIIKW